MARLNHTTGLTIDDLDISFSFVNNQIPYFFKKLVCSLKVHI